MEEEVGECAGAFLFWGVGRLEYESGLDGKEEAGRVKELGTGINDGRAVRLHGAYGMRREEDELVREDSSPDDGSEL
jgi:hypothetical protein